MNFVAQVHAQFLQASIKVNSSTIHTLHLNKNQEATFELVRQSMQLANLQFINFFFDHGGYFLAKERLYGGIGISSALGENQWQLEVENIHNTTLAFLHMRVVEHASPPRTGLDKYIIPPDTFEGQHLCNIQKIPSSLHQSFSVVGLAIIILGGCFITVLRFSLPEAVGRIQLQFGKGLHRRLDWVRSDALQLLRLVLEGQGIKRWKGKDCVVPVTEGYGREFSLVLDDSDTETVGQVDKPVTA